jgi:hypothetical protein
VTVPHQPFADLRVAGRPSLSHVDLVELDGLRFSDGLGFPPSYRGYIRHAGWARLVGLWLIYPPVLAGWADGLSGRGGVLTRRFREAYEDGRVEEFDWMIEPDGSWELVASLEVFGWSENGDYLLWDTSSRTPDGEFPVWVSWGGDALHRAGADLREALLMICGRVAGRTSASGYELHPLEPSPL